MRPTLQVVLSGNLWGGCAAEIVDKPCARLARAEYELSWCCPTRFDLVDDEVLAAMKPAWCRLVLHFVPA